MLAAALPLIGHEAIRSRGTIGGSLAHADPAAELPAVARALDAEFVVRGPSGERVIPAAEWFEGYLTTSRRPDELLVEVRFPTAGPGTGVSFQEVARRHGDFAIVGLAASLTLSDGRDQRCPAGVCRRVRRAGPGGRRGGSPGRREAVGRAVR